MAAQLPIPPVLKPITPYVTRGRELLRANEDRIIIFHCFKHAMDLGLKYDDKSSDSRTFLGGLMNELEAMKPSLAGRSGDELREHCRKFADGVLKRADAVDKAGNADKSTAQTYYAAATFFEILKQFSPDKELDEDTKQLVIFCKFRATEIIRAVKEGRKPAPPGAADGSGDADNTHHDDHTNGLVTSNSAQDDIPVARPAPTSFGSPSTGNSQQSYGRPVGGLSKVKKTDCLELIRFGRAAIEADDIPAAIERLQAALKMLHE